MNDIKEMILNRLYESNGVVANGMKTLLAFIPVDDVLRAINIDEYFFKEKEEKDNENKDSVRIKG